jgi:hypothetical protein
MTRARLIPAAGDQFVRLDRDRNAIVRIETAARQLGGNLAHRVFDNFGLLDHAWTILLPLCEDLKDLGMLPFPTHRVSYRHTVAESDDLSRMIEGLSCRNKFGRFQER